jgi:FkbM family methyltransferase
MMNGARPLLSGGVIAAAILLVVLVERDVLRAESARDAALAARDEAFANLNAAVLGHSENAALPPISGARLRPRMIQNLLFSNPNCQDKGAYVRQWRGEAVVVEVGAYRGEELVMFKGLVHKLYTYEPSPAKAAEIRSTIASNGMSDVVVFRPVAASDHAGEASFFVPSAEGTQQDSLGDISFLDNLRRSITVPLVRLDDEIHERVHLLKIDTQGHEMGVVKGAEGIIKNYGIDIIHAEFSPGLMRGHGVKPEDFLEYMFQLGYTCFYCTEAFGIPASNLPDFSGTRSAPWEWGQFTKDFGEYPGIVGHGAWGDLVCV